MNKNIFNFVHQISAQPIGFILLGEQVNRNINKKLYRNLLAFKKEEVLYKRIEFEIFFVNQTLEAYSLR